MTDHKDRIKKAMPGGYSELFGRKDNVMTEAEWQSIVDIHRQYINDFRERPYSEVTEREKEFFKMGIEGFAELQELRRRGEI